MNLVPIVLGLAIGLVFRETLAALGRAALLAPLGQLVGRWEVASRGDWPGAVLGVDRRLSRRGAALCASTIERGPARAVVRRRGSAVTP